VKLRATRHGVAIVILVGILATGAWAKAPRQVSPRPVSTYSIVARDPATGDLGVAVQSHWFSVGSVVTWAEAGVGAVATQSFVETSYGPLGLAAMRGGKPASQALKELVGKDAHPEVRQVAFVDAAGRVAAHTGKGCIPGAGHRTGEGYSVQANLMLTDEVPDAMATAFEESSGPLAERLVAALRAAQDAGGDIRGKQSAALLVVRAKPSEHPWTDRLIDLRIEDHEHPVEELERLLRLHRAYEKMNSGDEAVAAGDMIQALKEYSSAEAMFPDNDEFVFWHAVTLVTNDRVDEALPLFARAFRMNPNWMLLIPRLVEVDQLPTDPELAKRILSTGPQASLSDPGPE
jgi:uncharacterized Ntn-hydrolase superfamily protein